MATIVGTGLAILCFVGIPLQMVGMLVKGHSIWASHSWSVGPGWPWTAVVAIVGTAHGFLYIAYLLVCMDLASRARLRSIQLLGMVCSGLVPLLAFYTERKVSQRVKAQMALGSDAPLGPAASLWAALVRRPGTTRWPPPGTGADDEEEAGDYDAAGGPDNAGDYDGAGGTVRAPAGTDVES
jgi:integral membrane protein